MSKRNLLILGIILFLMTLVFVLFLQNTKNTNKENVIDVVDNNSEIINDDEEKEENTPQIQDNSNVIGENLNSRKFNLFSYNGVVSPGEYTLEFNNDSMSAKFCNNMSGQFTLLNGQLKVTQMASTLMLCQMPEDLMSLESAFQGMMSNGANLSLLDGQLTLSNNGNAMIFLENEEIDGN